MTPKEVLDFAKKNEAKILDLKFIDLLGSWQHFSVPISELEVSLFEEGLGFDEEDTLVPEISFCSGLSEGNHLQVVLQ